MLIILKAKKYWVDFTKGATVLQVDLQLRRHKRVLPNSQQIGSIISRCSGNFQSPEKK